MLALTCLLAETVGEKKSELICSVPFFFGPSIVLAFLGYQGTKSRALPVVLLVIATLSSALWIWITSSLLTTARTTSGFIDPQAGMAAMFVAVVQWFIVVLTIPAFLLLRKGSE